MFERFLEAYRLLPGGQTPGDVWPDERLMATEGYAELAGRFAGCSFEDGLYRLHDSTTAPQAQLLVEEAFPEHAGTFSPFAQDWTGTQYAVATVRRRFRTKSVVLLFDPGAGEALQPPDATFVSFHDDVLVDDREVLAGELFRRWAAREPGSLPPAPGTCIGFRVPLFLDGEEDVDNLEVSDLDVYWSLSGDLRLATAGLEVGTPITGVTGSG